MRTALAILLGERCVVCGKFHVGAGICPECLLRLPYINIRGVAGNPIERQFWLRMPIERASAMLLYRPGYEVASLLHAFKYHGRQDLAVMLGRMIAREHQRHGFFDTIDGIQPIPLHPQRQRERGYNQSERIAQGIAEITGLPIVNLVRRIQDNASQTQLQTSERRKNVENIFAAIPQEITQQRGRHILIVDDVITLGATISSCAKALVEGYRSAGLDVEEIRFSVLSIAYAGKTHLGRLEDNALGVPDCRVSNQEFLERQYAPLA